MRSARALQDGDMVRYHMGPTRWRYGEKSHGPYKMEIKSTHCENCYDDECEGVHGVEKCRATDELI